MSVKDKRVQGGSASGANNPVIYEETILSTSTADLDTGSQITSETLAISPYNEITFTVDAASMSAVDAGTYVYDIQYANGNEVRTVLEGLFIVNPDVAFSTGPAIYASRSSTTTDNKIDVTVNGKNTLALSTKATTVTIPRPYL